jgi:hypothetical protein
VSGGRREWLITAALIALMTVVWIAGLRLGGLWEYAFPIYILAVLVAGRLYLRLRRERHDSRSG